MGTSAGVEVEAAVLFLDSEAISSIARGPAHRRDKVRALITAMRTHDQPIAVCAAVLAEVVRGRSGDASVFAALRRERIVVPPVDARVGARAGQLLGATGAGSEDAIDAFSVAVADLSGGAVIATTDPADLSSLADHAEHVLVVDIR